jgi:hypothetical protein
MPVPRVVAGSARRLPGRERRMRRRQPVRWDPAIQRRTVTRGAIEKGAGQVLSVGLDAAIVSTDRPPLIGVGMAVLRKYTCGFAVPVPGESCAGLWR